MGCSASKSTESEKNIPPASTGGDNVRIRRENSSQRRKSIDSGISLNGEYTLQSPRNDAISKPGNCSSDRPDRKGIAFEISLDNSVITRSPPKRLTQCHSQSRHRSQATNDGSEAMTKNMLAEKQIRAEQLREVERHSVVARQRLREVRARQVQERRQKLQEDLEMSQDEEFSDIEVDINFHDADDYDFSSSDAEANISIPHENHQSIDDDCAAVAPNQRNDDESDNF